MDLDELKELINEPETEKVELKENFDKKKVLRTVAAFATIKGGTIIVGVSNDGDIRGVKLGKETLQTWTNEIAQNTEPHIVPNLELINVDKKHLIIIGVPESPIKPVYAHGKPYKRVPGGNQVISPQEAASMHFDSIGLS
jgi:ATP-dependent DNA helicase RecG